MAANSTSIYIDYNQVKTSATKIGNKNDELREQLRSIENYITGLEGTWESDSAQEIRSKIRGMESTFAKYFDIVDNYKRLLNNAVTAYQSTEATNKGNASQFV
ncbi:MAG: WXG100 family type VII secretion target [Lachnospiraceae bacterium]|nr:WXG100 family type VII secretion target [Lachnospiraceae bacterium]